MSWFSFANNIFQYDLELNFVDRINLFIRASCIASVPPLSNLFVIPILILIVEKFQRSNNLIEDTYHYQKFLDVNIQLVREHFQSLLLYEINLFGLAVLDPNQVNNFQGKCVVITAIFCISRFIHIYQTVFINSKEQASRNYEMHLSTFGENLSL